MPFVPKVLDPADADMNERAIELLRRYFGLADNTAFTGSRFESLGGGGDAPDTANVITAADILSLSTLSIRVHGSAVLQLLEDEQFSSEASDYLAQIPANLDLVDADPTMLAKGSPAYRLWHHLKRLYRFGATTTSKLMARKRPWLIPVYDSVIDRAFGLGSSAGQWDYWYAVLTSNDRKLHKHLLTLRYEAGLPEQISPLRVLDVVAWMRYHEPDGSGDEDVLLPAQLNIEERTPRLT